MNLLCRSMLPLVAAATLAAACTRGPIASRDDAIQVRPNAVRAHMEFLADDLLEGREAGTRGYDLAARYVASVFQEIGLQPAGSDGYFQHVPLQRAVLVPGSVALTVTGPRGTRRFTDADHLVAYPSARDTVQRITAPLVFAGHGVVAPEYGRDDYAGLDVAGKFVVLLGGPAPGFPAEVAAHLGSTDEQRARAAERGALGVLLVYTPALEARFPFDRLDEVARQPTVAWRDSTGGQDGVRELRASAMVDSTAAAALFDGARRSYADVLREAAAARPPAGFPLATTVTLERRAAHQRSSSANVIGLLPGSDPELADEVIVVTTHLDHVGIGAPKDGDSVYNGALDNASGVAGTLEIARAIKAGAAAPRRSLLFAAVTAEEKGLVGSDYLARHPTVAPRRIVGVINFDGALPFYDFVDVIGYGAERSTLGRSLERAAGSLGVAVTSDPMPEQSIFTRSDHYPFVRQGVPAVFVLMGFGRPPGGMSGREHGERFAAEHLHQPSDDLDLPIDYAVLARFADLFRRFTLEAATAAERPLWYDGDFFAQRFAPRAQKAPRPR